MNSIKLKYSFLLVMPLLLFHNNGKSVKEFSTKEKEISSKFINPCPVETEQNETLMHDFITEPEWQQGRQETNTEQITAGEIKLLISVNDRSVCETFNTKFQEAFTEKWPDGLSKNDITYYKTENFYFVIITPNQPDELDEFVEGQSNIFIFDKNLNFISGYFY